MSQVDKDVEEFLRLHPVVPKRKPKAPLPKLAVASIAEPPTGLLRWALTKAHERLLAAEQQEAKQEAERRSCKPVENMRRYGRAKGPLSEDEARLLHFQTGVDFAKETQRRARMLERFYQRQLNESGLGLYGEETLEELVDRQNRR